MKISYWTCIKCSVNVTGKKSSFLKKKKFIYLFIFGCVGSSFLCKAFSSCSERGPLFIAVHGPLTVAASPIAEHRLQTRRLSSCGSRAQSLCGMWDLPGLGHEPMSPALAGGFPTTAPPEKPKRILFESRARVLSADLIILWCEVDVRGV